MIVLLSGLIGNDEKKAVKENDSNIREFTGNVIIFFRASRGFC